MHTLSREIRFTVSPFEDQADGYNSYCSSPDTGGAGLFLSVWVEIAGEIDKETGFIINLSDIDRISRKSVAAIFGGKIKNAFAEKKPVSFEILKSALTECTHKLNCDFSNKLHSLAVKINPFRKIKIYTENKNVIHYSEKFEFAAMHKLWNDNFREEENFAKFGKCANPTGHGHNYIVEVAVQIHPQGNFNYGEFQKIVDDNVIEILDHKNLNCDVEYFNTTNPTVENITTFAWQKLKGKFQDATLAEITIWENDRAYCSYREER